jgi:peroxiredoxin
VPVFRLDPEEYLLRDSVEFVSADQVAAALGCKFSLSKDKASFDCTQNAEQFRRVGSAEGNVAPGLRYATRDDKIATLSDMRRDHKVVIVFVRSLDWDPFSQMLVRRLQSVQDSLRAANAQVVVIHGYGEKKNTIWQDSLRLTCPLIPDDASAVMRGYDVFDRGPLPHPAVFVVDQSGVIRLRKVFDDLSVAPDISDVMESVAHLP